MRLYSTLLAVLLLLALASTAPAAPSQTIFLNRAPGAGYDQNRPETITDAVFTEILEKVDEHGTPARRLGLSFILSYLNGPPDAIEEALRRLLAQSRKHRTPVLIVLDGQNWWGDRSDLWNWWDKSKPGYDPDNRRNVEWVGPSPEHAIKIAWRNWGRQIRVLPPPNLASPRFREVSRTEMLRLSRVIHGWARALPAEEKFLFPGVKVGWEASLGINAFYYPGGNALLEEFPNDPRHDPQHGLDMKRDFAGGLALLGYAALQSKGWAHKGPITLADQERITQDYLAFLARTAREVGLAREEIWTHASGQFAPWEKHMTHAVAINGDSLPGWSLYGHAPSEAGDLGASLKRAGLQTWAAAEWLPHARSAEEWEAAYNRTLAFRDCRYVSVYNWEGIRDKPEAIEGLRRALRAPQQNIRLPR